MRLIDNRMGQVHVGRVGRLWNAFVLLTSMLVIMTLPHPASSCEELPFAFSTYPVGSYPISLILSDLDGNGDPELSTLNRGSGDISILSATGFDAFSPIGLVPVGGNPLKHAVGDFNNDGKQDFVVINAFLSQASLFYQGTSLDFSTRTDYSAPFLVREVLAADVNGDNWDDLVLSGFDSVIVFTNTQAGAFYPLFSASVSEGSIWYMALADLNGDDNPDLILGGDSLHTWLGDGHGQFTPHSVVESGFDLSQIRTDDVNGDGHVDVLVSLHGGNSVRVFFGDGTGDLELGNEYPVGNGPTDLLLADLNDDGFKELIATNENANTLTVYRGASNGVFHSRIDIPTLYTGQRVVVHDVNEDGKLDLLVSSFFADAVAYHPGIGAGLFAPPGPSFPTGEFPWCMVSADLNGDGYDDIITVNYASHDVSIHLANPGSDFVTSTLFIGNPPTWATVADLNADGRLDLVVLRSGEVRIYEGDGAGGFTLRTIITDSVYAGIGQGCDVADVNGDGIPDLVTTGHSLLVYVGLGNFQFGPPTMYPTGNVTGVPVLADLNGDGVPDVVFHHSIVNRFTVKLNDGFGVFGLGQHYGASGARRVKVADLNQDGVLDVAVLTQPLAKDSVTVWLGNGDGSLWRHSAYSVGQFPKDMAIGDFNNDNVLDIATANGSANTVTLLEGVGDGTFLTRGDRSAGFGPSCITIAQSGESACRRIYAGNDNDNTISIIGLSGSATSSVLEPVRSTPLRISLTANPVVNRISAMLETEGEQYITLVLCDVQGRRVQEVFSGLISPGKTFLEQSVPRGRNGLRGGVYFLTATNRSGRIVYSTKLTLR